MESDGRAKRMDLHMLRARFALRQRGSNTAARLNDDEMSLALRSFLPPCTTCIERLEKSRSLGMCSKVLALSDHAHVQSLIRNKQ